MGKEEDMKDKKEKAFNNWKHNAIHLTFPNGNSLSTVWGYCNYCDNYDVEGFDTFMDSNTVEIMILNAPDKLRKKIEKKYDFGGNIVKGYVTMAQWLDIVKKLST